MATTTSPAWTAADVPDQTGRVAIVTGANTGIGLEASRVLAQRGASVVLACRNVEKANAALASIERDGPATTPEVEQLDLASLASIEDFAGRVHDRHSRVDVLINNAGLMWTPRSTTADGFELQFGTNHLGHFALTGRVLDLLLTVPDSRVVTVSSMGHRTGRIHFDDLQSQRRYGRHRAYAQSKLANLMFTFELQRRLAVAGAPTIAVAAHPGTTSTELVRYSPAVIQAGNRAFEALVSQDAPMGALPTLRAATDPAVQGGEYYGPSGLLELKGPPRRVQPARRARDAEAQRRLWAVSEELTGVRYPI
jgi:NAD(P)-dependent dehydrogenase (short-subunit alcohol dehydrogenase family)